MISRMTRMWALACLFVLAFAGTAQIANAQATPDAVIAPPTFVFQPKQADLPYFSVEMEAGTTEELTVLITADRDGIGIRWRYDPDRGSGSDDPCSW